MRSGIGSDKHSESDPRSLLRAGRSSGRPISERYLRQDGRSNKDVGKANFFPNMMAFNGCPQICFSSKYEPAWEETFARYGLEPPPSEA